MPYIEAKNRPRIEHEATTSKVSEEQLFYCLQRGQSAEEATALIVNGFVGTCCSNCRWNSRSRRRNWSRSASKGALDDEAARPLQVRRKS